jgi:acetyl-CoA acetyltransferase
VAEVHDATAYAELYLTEQMGFCGEGEGGPLAESGATGPGGRIPVNTSGGLVSRGHPIGASGLAMIYEMVTQLRGEAGGRQVENARIALVNNGGGTIGTGEAAMCQTLLQKL